MRNSILMSFPTTPTTSWGNITSLQRNGFADADFGTSVDIDNLVYAYDGNQLLAVQDMSNSLNGFRVVT